MNGMQTELPFAERMDLGPSARLREGGVLPFSIVSSRTRHPIPCFVVRKRGRVHAFVNRCMHWPVTLDMETNDFWDVEGEYIQCKTHGALYEAFTGTCIAGPCTGETLIRLPVHECNGQIYLDGTRLPDEVFST